MSFQRNIITPRAVEPVIRLRGKPFGLAAALALALEEHRRGNIQSALDIYTRIIAKAPNYAEAYNNRGALLQAASRFAEALSNYDRAIQLKPGYANAHYNRGTVLKKLLRREEAIGSYDQAIALRPDHAEAYNNRGVALQDLKRYHEALASYEKAVELKPEYAEAWNNRGIVLASRGDMTAAATMFQKAFELKPDFVNPLFNLANIRTYHEVEAVEARRICALLAKPGLSLEDQEQLNFSLGKIYDDCGRYDEAFACFQLANSVRNRQVAYDAAMVEKMTDRIVGVFDREFLAEPFSFASESRTPVFIVGMPRSGTTLLASILSNHPAIASAGELSMIPDLVFHLRGGTGDGDGYPMAARQLSAEVGGRIIQQYEDRLRRDVGQGIAYMIDKNPLNFRHLGFICKLFPQARIFHCARHPGATGLSNYFQRFPLQLDYSFDLRNTGHFYREYNRFMEHWAGIPALKVMEISYEEMVLQTETVAREALKFLGLEWDARCLAPHTNPYAVDTASHWQVRQPIYQHSLENWRHYERHLLPFFEALQARR